MEEKKKKKQEEKTKKDAAQKKVSHFMIMFLDCQIDQSVAEQKTKVPDSAKPSPSLHPANPNLTLSPSVASSSGNGKRAPSSAQQQQQQPLPSLRYPPREVPPRFRHQEHKQLLKRGQPLPVGSALSVASSSVQLGTSSPPQSPSAKLHTELSHPSSLGTQYESTHWGLPNHNNSNTGWDQVISDENSVETWPTISLGNSHTPSECTSDSDHSQDVKISSMSMATGAGQPAHYPISKNSHTSDMVSSQGGPNRGWGSEGKNDGLGGRGQPSWSSPTLNLNPNANPSAWPVLGHEGPGMGGSNMCGPGNAHPVHSTNGSMGNANGNLVGNCGTGVWGSSDATEQHQSPSANMSFSMGPQNLNTDGPNLTKQEPISQLLRQSPTESSQVNGDGEPLWGSADTKTGEPKDSGWDSTGISSWGRGGSGGGNTGNWCDWGKQSSGEASGWDTADGQPHEQMSSWTQVADAPTSEGSGDSGGSCSRRRERSSSEEMPPLLPRQDLDPRVLCNSGWGQTPVRQHTVWEMEEVHSDRKTEAGPEVWSSSSNTTTSGPPPVSTSGANLSSGSRPESGVKNESAGPNGSPAGWGVSTPHLNQPATGWGDPPNAKKVSNGSGSGWGDPPPTVSNNNGSQCGQSWGSEEKSPSWEDGQNKAKPQGWGDGPKQSQGWASGGNSSSSAAWGEQSEVKKNGTGSTLWEGEGSGWKEGSRNYGKAAPGIVSNWPDAPRTNGPVQSWGGKPQEGPNGGAPGASSVGSWGGSNSVKQNGGSGWASGARQDTDSTGWEEPSPPSIRRKMEIDDGTSTWGDPSTYSKAVNMWDRNHTVSQGNSGPGNGGSGNNHSAPINNNHHHPHHNQAPMQNHSNGSNNNGSPNQAGPPQSRPSMVTPGWGELPNVQAKTESSSWGEPSNTAAVDNGTSAWGKPPRGCGGWADGVHEPSGPYRANPPPGSAPCKQATKSMQDGWGSGGEDMGMPASQWETDDGDMWNSPASQESNSSCNSWGNPPKKGLQKVQGKMPNKQDDAWIMSRLIKQLTDMGFPKDPAEEALKSNNMNLDQAMSALLEKKTELDRRGMGMTDYNNGLNKPIVCRPPALSKDTLSDRAPFLDKDAGLSDDTPTSPFMPSPGLKLPLANSSLPGHGLGGVSSGLAMQNLNNRQLQNGMFGSSGAAQARALQQTPQAPPPQPSVPSLSSSQPLRTQVPQFLSPQVQAQLLQFAAKNIGLNPALLTSPINPQQMTLLYQLQQLHMTYQRLQIQQQMMQAQRSVSGSIRQQEQQVARTINNMQQQIQQHQRQLAQALLMKQQPPPPHSGLHPSAGKSALDNFPGHLHSSGLNDLQTKEAQSSPNSFSSYPLAGLNPNCMEVGGVSIKDPPQPQSRLSQWTHPNSMDSLPGNGTHMEPNLNKHAWHFTAPNQKSPMEDSYSTYTLMPNSESPTSPLVPPESWNQGKSPNEKISNGTNINWPPEFCPGVPWKGLQNIDPETDPNMTPGSVPSGPTINTNIQDVNRYLLRDRSGGSSPTSTQNGALLPSSKLLDMKSTWSSGPISHTQASLSHELWKVPPGTRNTTAPSRPPPGLTNAKPASTWGGNSLGLSAGWNSSYSSDGTTWSTDSSNRTSSWLVLRNLTPQIDGSTLRTLCMQHGPLITFHLNLTQGNAVVRYSSKEEAAKAQKSLHMCVLGNTTILAEFAGEEEVNRFFAQGQSLTPTTSWQANAGTNQTRLAGTATSNAVGHWSGGGGGGGGKAGGGSGGAGDLLWGGVQQYSSLWGPPSGEDTRVIGSPIPINTLLPGDLLSGESM
ncbi:trinucleotide repeat-containing gene 6C protein isoform X4 [Denticeps clupeoides]|uniref:trinucleotide repeat-containing gene 6C protein isoform X4 n=1 Tax=Denticeps clupeoides TaxID=299321 RepID=UPI0010A53953|nr:trinucleotide repeat-containing gene 6C protein-like isoform X4 [Denticeps clupeoides]